jgi:hypothetical protein
MNRTLLDTDILSDFLRGQNINVLCRAQAWLQNAEVLAFDDKSARLGGEIAQPGTLPAPRSLRSHHRELAGIGLRQGLARRW